MTIVLLWLALLMAACGGSRTQASDESVLIRTPRPTFTPTLASAAPVPADQAGQAGTDQAGAAAGANAAPVPVAAPAPVSGTGAKAIVNSPLVNARTGPDVSFDVVSVVERGQEFDILGKNAAGDWWYVCCLEGATAWIVGELVDTDGAVDAVPVTAVGGAVRVQPTALPPTAQPAPPAAQAVTPNAAPTAAPANAAAPSANDYVFDLIIQEQFPEDNVVRVFGYILDDTQALADYSLRVRKDGSDMPLSGASFGGQPGFTWPFADARQRLQNLKVEFPGAAASGTWEVQLVDSGGTPVAPPAVFELAANEANRELYVRYERR